MEVNSSMAEAVSSSAPACCSVRAERSRLPLEISEDAVLIVSVPLRTSLTIFVRLSFILFNARNNCPVSSFLAQSIVAVRSPSATLSATETASLRGREMILDSHVAVTMATPIQEVSIKRINVRDCW